MKMKIPFLNKVRQNNSTAPPEPAEKTVKVKKVKPIPPMRRELMEKSRADYIRRIENRRNMYRKRGI